MSLPYIDPHETSKLSDDHIKYFNQYGFLVFRNVLSQNELMYLKEETLELIQNAQNKPALKDDADYWFNDEIPIMWYKSHGGAENYDHVEIGSKKGVPFRIEYPVDKSKSCQVLMGHPFVLTAMEQLLGTKDFIPTWDSLVFKMDGEGVPIKWHRDASAESVGFLTPAIDVGFYLDSATVDQDNCLWVIPGSHKWPDSIASHLLEHLSNDGFKRDGAIPVPVEPGDVILHNILILHGSSSSKSPLRRTVYFEYRSMDHERQYGPHKADYLPLKQRLLHQCLETRNNEFKSFNADIRQEKFCYSPSNISEITGMEPLSSLRFAHKEYFRPDYKG